jgi:hypothetical protein
LSAKEEKMAAVIEVKADPTLVEANHNNAQGWFWVYLSGSDASYPVTLGGLVSENTVSSTERYVGEFISASPAVTSPSVVEVVATYRYRNLMASNPNAWVGSVSVRLPISHSVRAPTAPYSINYPMSAQAGDFVINWTEYFVYSFNDTSGYILERSVNGGGWQTVYKGEELMYTDSIQASWDTVQYRVKSYAYYPGVGIAYSGYRTGIVATDHNEPPTVPSFINVPEVITINSKPRISWGESTDPEGTDINYVLQRRFDNEVYIEIYRGTAQSTKDLLIPASKNLVQYRVKAVDADSIESDWITSPAQNIVVNTPPTESVDEIDFYAPVVPIFADSRPSNVLINVSASKPEGSILQVWVCNNGKDEEPSWEDCTNVVLTKRVYNFINNAKISPAWGVKLHVKLQRGSAVGDVSITSVGVSFR